MVHLASILLQFYIKYEQIRGDRNSPKSLNVMLNYHYHGENNVITW